MAFVSVEGTISRVFYDGKGAEVVETFKKRDGSDATARYSLWFTSPHNLSEGDTGKWSGALSVKVEPWTDRDGKERQAAKISLNGARAVPALPQGGQQPQSAPEPDPWVTGAQTGADGFSTETPFG